MLPDYAQAGMLMLPDPNAQAGMLMLPEMHKQGCLCYLNAQAGMLMLPQMRRSLARRALFL